MDSGMIGKIQKAKMYAEQPERIRFESFLVTFEGTNNNHQVMLKNENWNCTCDFFKTRGVCSHTMALEKIFGKMLPEHLLS